MFGYVDVYKDELKIKEYNTYKAYYCGLCKQIGKNHNQISRFALNYDFTFMAILLDSVSDDKTYCGISGCVKRLGKRKIVKNATGLELSADMNVLFAFFKLKDDICDTKSFKAMLEIVPFALRVKKLRKKYPSLYKEFDACLKRLKFLEDDRCDVTDKVAHEFACIMQKMFECANPSLSQFGYNLGRLIYIMDACDDIPDDLDTQSYNPILVGCNYNQGFDKVPQTSITDLLYNSLAALAYEYEQLDVKKNKAILDNIIYLGLRAKCDKIINKIFGCSTPVSEKND